MQRLRKRSVPLWKNPSPAKPGTPFTKGRLGLGVAAVPLWEKSLPRQAGYSLYEREIGVGDFCDFAVVVKCKEALEALH